MVSTDLSIDIVGRDSVETRSIAGRYSVETRSRLGRQSVDSRTIVGRYSVETQSTFVPTVSRPIFFHRYFTDISPHFTDTSPIIGRYLTDVLVSNWSTLGGWSLDTWSIASRWPFDISVESRPIVDRYIGRDICRSV